MRSRRDGGAAAVEFALVAPVLLLVVFGLVDIGMMFYTKSTLAAGAREAVRTLMYTPTSTANDLAAQISSYTSVKVTAAEVAYTPCPAPTDPLIASKRASVTVTHPYKYLTPLDGFVRLFGGQMASTVTVREVATFRCLG